jgi:hypothetical protein
VQNFSLILKLLFPFFEPFRPRSTSKLAKGGNDPKHFIYKNSIWVSKNAKFGSVEKVQNTYEKKATEQWSFLRLLLCAKVYGL